MNEMDLGYVDGDMLRDLAAGLKPVQVQGRERSRRWGVSLRTRGMRHSVEHTSLRLN